jgi:hypothetical protein
MSEAPYCELCYTNTEAFDYRFDYPVCNDCVDKYSLEPDKEDDNE